MGKQKTTQTSQNTYGWQNNPGSADINALRDMKATIDPSIPFHFANAKEDLKNSYNNPLGASTTPAVRDNATRAANRNFDQLEGQAMGEAQHEVDNANFDRQARVAQMTAPALTQTGGTNNQAQSGGFWGGLLNSTMQGAGGAAIM